VCLEIDSLSKQKGYLGLKVLRSNKLTMFQKWQKRQADLGDSVFRGLSEEKPDRKKAGMKIGLGPSLQGCHG